MTSHRRGRHRLRGQGATRAAAAALAGAFLVAGFTLVIDGPTTAADRVPTTAATPTARVPASATRPATVIYDDDTDRGQARCDAWQRAQTTPGDCTVWPISVGPDPSRARAEQDQWETDHGEGPE